MGILDDAIREHLELKRQHGAAEEELRRQEEEALGPARREVVPADSADGEGAAEPEAHDQETMLQEPEADTPAATEEGPGFLVGDADGDADVTPIEPEGAAATEIGDEMLDPERLGEAEIAEERLAEEGAAEGAEPAEQREIADQSDQAELTEPGFPEVDEPAEEAPPEPAGDTEPSGFEAVDEDEPVDEEEEDADVLEDTPDFLQETPEHDRLWFEQKPPRDFDFD